MPDDTQSVADVQPPASAQQQDAAATSGHETAAAAPTQTAAPAQTLQPQAPQGQDAHGQVAQTAPPPTALDQQQRSIAQSGGLRTAPEVFGQLDDVFQLPSFKSLYIYQLERSENDSRTAQAKLDAALVKDQALVEELASVKSDKRVLRVLLKNAEGVGKGQALLYLLAGTALQEGLQRVSSGRTYGWPALIVAAAFVLIGYLMTPATKEDPS